MDLETFTVGCLFVLFFISWPRANYLCS